MISLADKIASDLAAPACRDLQERLLQAMFMMERYRGIDAGSREAVGEITDADVSEAAIGRLAAALVVFIRGHPTHNDVGSAIWALGKLRDPAHATLFRAIVDQNSGYNDFARDQAQCALDDQGYESKNA